MHIVKLVVTVEFTPSAGLWCRLLREPRGPKWMPGSGPAVWNCLIRGSSLKLSRNFYGFLILSRIADLLHALAQSRGMHAGLRKARPRPRTVALAALPMGRQSASDCTSRIRYRRHAQLFASAWHCRALACLAAGKHPPSTAPWRTQDPHQITRAGFGLLFVPIPRCVDQLASSCYPTRRHAKK